MKSPEIEEIRKKIKSINTDEELDEIDEMLDRMDGSFITQNPRVTGLAADAAKHGVVQEVNVTNEYDQQHVLGGSSQFIDVGRVRVDISIVADPRDLYDD